jgi:hypothetical protein
MPDDSRAQLLRAALGFLSLEPRAPRLAERTTVVLPHLSQWSVLRPT